MGFSWFDADVTDDAVTVGTALGDLMGLFNLLTLPFDEHGQAMSIAQVRNQALTLFLDAGTGAPERRTVSCMPTQQ